MHGVNFTFCNQKTLSKQTFILFNQLVLSQIAPFSLYFNILSLKFLSADITLSLSYLKNISYRNLVEIIKKLIFTIYLNNGHFFFYFRLVINCRSCQIATSFHK